jgi:hypothetical protein
VWKLQQQVQTRSDNTLQWNNWCGKQSVCPIGESTSEASALRRLVSFLGWLEQGCCPAIFGHLLFPGKQSPAKEGHSGSRGCSCMVKLISDALPFKRSWLDSTVVDPRSNLCYFNCSGDRQQQKGPCNGVLIAGHFILLPRQITMLPWQQCIISTY